MSKLSDLMKRYGSGEISLDDTVHSLLRHVWVTPNRFGQDADKLPAVVKDSWDEIEYAFNEGIISFSQYRQLSVKFDSMKKSYGIIVP